MYMIQKLISNFRITKNKKKKRPDIFYTQIQINKYFFSGEKQQ